MNGSLFYPQKFCAFTFHVLHWFCVGLSHLLSSESSPKILLPSNVGNKSETCNTFCSIKNRKTTLTHALSSLTLKLVLRSSYGCSGKTTTGKYRIMSPGNKFPPDLCYSVTHGHCLTAFGFLLLLLLIFKRKAVAIYICSHLHRLGLFLVSVTKWNLSQCLF